MDALTTKPKTKEDNQSDMDSAVSKEEAFFNERYTKYFDAEKARHPDNKSCKSCSQIEARHFREVYLDHNATTYIRPEVQEVLVEYYQGKYSFANPSSKTVQGDYTTDLVLTARKQIAAALSVSPGELYFTGSGSEANNLAIKGIAFKNRERKGHLITSKAEHPSVLKTMEYLEERGYQVTYLDVDNRGMVQPDSVKNALTGKTILVSIMAANNEIGTLNPTGKIGAICKEQGIPFMTDAIQAFGKIPLNPKEMGISLLSISGHKIYGPKGIGALYVEQGISLVPQVHGGGQEAGLRGGTENVGSIMAFGKAAELISGEMENEKRRLNSLTEYFLEGIKKIEKNIAINGPAENRLPNNISIGFPGQDSGALIGCLNKLGISVSASSACSSRKIKTSHVLKAIGADTANFGTIRFGFGLKTNKDDLDYVLFHLEEIISRLKKI